MAEDDVTIGITVEDSTAMAKLAELQAELAKTQSAGMGGGAGSMRAGISVGQVFPAELEKMAAAGGRYKQVLNQVTGATNELSEETEKAGINIESMMTRMATRLAIMEVARLAIGAVVNAFKEMAAIETAKVNFENLTIAVQSANDVEQSLTRTTLDTNIAFEKLAPAIISLEDAGEGPLQAAEDVDSLAKRAAVTGDDVDKLAKALERVKLGEGSVQDMFELAHAAGTAKDELVGQVSVYAQLQRENKELNDAGQERLRVLREQTHEIDRQIEAAKAADKEQFDATENQIREQQKLTDLRESFLEKVLGAEGKPPGQADPTLMRAMQPGSFFHPGGLPETAGGKQMTKDIQLGFQEIYKEEDLTTEGMQHFVNTGVIGLRDILAAAKRFHEAEDAARKAAEADRQKAFDDEKKINDQKLQSAADAEGERRRNATVEADRTRRDINQQIVKAIQDQSNIADELNKKMGTVNEQWSTFWTSLKTIVTSQPVQQALGVLSMLSGVEQFGGAGRALHWAAGQLPQSMVSDTKRTADNTEKIANSLAGAGTP